LHNCSLLIDDFYDNTMVRRGQPAAHVKYGAAQTLGTAYSTGFQCLLSMEIHFGHRCAVKAMEEFTRAQVGNGWEVLWRETGKCPTHDEYMASIDGKTGSPFRAAIFIMMECSTRVLPENGVPQERIMQLATVIGRLFQVLDDLLDLTSEEYLIKKGSYGSDLIEGKYSYPLLVVASQGTEQQYRIDDILQREDLSQSDIIDTIEFVRKSGGLQATMELVEELHEECQSLMDEIDSAFEVGPNLELREWIDDLIGRVDLQKILP
jgi:geranylgeranyl diphosphate synthase type 3